MVSLIPQPARLDVSDAAPLALDGLVVRGDDPDQAALVVELLAAAGVAGVTTDARPGAPELVLRHDDAAGPAGSTSPERYSLVVTDAGATATAPEPVGLLHAARTLRQLVETAPDGTTRAPAVVVDDAPRYGWRGLSLDIARHFFDLSQLRQVVDVVASYKLDVLHLHLTDDQGWRIELPSRPELAKEASGSACGGGPGGYLSADDFRALQEYALSRHVAVVPEIDLPGHINAATQVYGELNPDGKPTEEYLGMEVGFSRLWFDLPATEPFLRDVLGDLAAMTLGEHLHIGGDEVMRMEADEFARFVELAERIVLEHGKKVVAWQEAAHAPLRPGTVVQYWDTNKHAYEPFLRAAAEGARFVMSPGNKVYLDMKYTSAYPLGQDWAGLVELRDSYDWDPETTIPGLPADVVDGVSAAVWTETLATSDELFDMLLPRLAAVAEVAWTAPERKDWESFRSRVAVEAASWRRAGLAYHRTPQVDW